MTGGTLSYYEQGSCEFAIGMQQMMDLSYALWQKKHGEPNRMQPAVVLP